MTHRRLSSSIPLAVLVAIGCGGGTPQNASAKTEGPAEVAQAPAAAASQASASTGGSAVIQATARLSGSPPPREAVKMSADPVCQSQHPSPFYAAGVVVDSQGMLQHVFVYVKEGLSGTFPAPAAPVTLDQNGCWYRPHVFGIQVDQPLAIVNSDATLHNVNAKPTANTPFNIAQPVKGMKTTKKFAKPEIMVKFKCNVHPWMSAYAGVVSHPFFGVTDERGAATISGLPAGTYTVEAWHEQYGAQTQSVSVASGETKTVEWTFKAQ